MKKSLIVTTLLSSLMVTSVMAARSELQNVEYTHPSQEQGGYQAGSAVMTVDKAKALSNDQWVMLRGKIEKRLSDENYLFRDNTGTIVVEIDEKYWAGVTVGPEDKVEISGKLDKKFNSTEVEVKSLRKLQ